MNHKLNKNVNNLKESGIRKVFTSIQNMKDPVNLSIGEPDFGYIPEVADSLHNAVSGNQYRYTATTGLPELRSKIAQKHVKNVSNVLITCGASGALDLVFRTLLCEADEVIIFEPYFLMYDSVPRLMGARVISVQTNDDFLPDLELLEKVITEKTKAIVLNSPNNPTGVVYPEEIIEKIATLAREREIYLISDEVYSDFVYDANHVSPLEYNPDSIVINSFSKNLALTGMRVGYIVASETIVEQMAKVQQVSYVCAPVVSQTAALENFDYDLSEIVSEYNERRKYIFDSLKNSFKIVEPHGAFYMYLKVGDGDRFAAKALEKELIVVPSSVFSKDKSYIRVSYATDIDTLKRGIEILKEVKDELGKL